MTPAGAACAAGIIALVFSHSPAASAAFSSGVAGTAAGFESGTLQPPGAVSASCTPAGQKARATVSWTASTSLYASGYSISHTGATVGTALATSSPATISGLTPGGTYTFTVTTTFRSWTSQGRSSLSIKC